MKHILCTGAKISMITIKFARRIDCGDGKVSPPLWATAIREQVRLKLNDPFTFVRTLSKYIPLQ